MKFISLSLTIGPWVLDEKRPLKCQPPGSQLSLPGGCNAVRYNTLIRGGASIKFSYCCRQFFRSHGHILASRCLRRQERHAKCLN